MPAILRSRTSWQIKAMSGIGLFERVSRIYNSLCKFEKKRLQPLLLNMTAFVVVYMLTCFICVLFCLYW